MNIEGKVIVVTGAGSGMGRETTLLLIKKGGRVAAVDINEEGLKETVSLAGDGGDRISTHIVDVTDKAAVDELPQAVVDAHGAVDGLINNAGIIQPIVPLSELEFSAIERVININLWGPIYFLKAFLPLIKERPEGHIVNISSMAGFFPFANQMIYGATKGALKQITESLHLELKETNVGVTVVFPGAIETNMTKNIGMSSNPDEGTESSYPMTPAPVAAEQIVEGIEKKKYSVFIGNDSKMMNLFYRLSPKRAVMSMYDRMQALTLK